MNRSIMMLRGRSNSLSETKSYLLRNVDEMKTYWLLTVSCNFLFFELFYCDVVFSSSRYCAFRGARCGVAWRAGDV